MARVLLAGAVAALLLSAAAAASSRVESRLLWRGPVVAGDGAVLWDESGDATGTVHLWEPTRGDRIVYRSDSLALSRPLAAAGRVIAFGRTFPSCPAEPGIVCPVAQDVLIGVPGGSFRTLVGPQTCAPSGEGDSVALAAGAAAYLTVDCARSRVRVLVRSVSQTHGRLALGKPTALADAPVGGGCCAAVAAAGRFVAWSDGRHAEVAVFDRRAGRIAYRAEVGPTGIGADLGFDLQPDGTLAVAYRLTEVARAGTTTVAWYSPSSPRKHVLPLRGYDTRVRIADDRIAVLRSVTAATTELVIAERAGRVHTVARFARPFRPRADFDFDGNAVVWAVDRIDRRRTECPPPGQGRPCVLRESGVTTIRVRGADEGSPRVVARLPFDDVSARGP